MNDSSEPTQQLAVVPMENPGTLMRHASDVAGVCREIVLKTASRIQGRQFVRVEGWQAIATAHGCCLSIEDVSEDELGNVTVWAAVRRLSDGLVLAKGQGFVGADERTWAKRDRYAKRAMAQTRAMSRVARSVFAHVVVLIDANLSTTPAEEMPENGDSHPAEAQASGSRPAPEPANRGSRSTSSRVKPASLASPEPPKGLTALLNAFQERCKERLVSKAQENPKRLPYWQRYAVDKGWILPNEGIESILGNPAQVFVLDYNKDVASNTPAVQEQFLAHEKAVMAMAAQGGAEKPIDSAEHVDDEESSGGAISIAGRTSVANIGCPNCGSMNVGLSKDYDGILVCQACAWQWDVQSGDYYEEHEWAKTICPIPPKGMPKKQYEEQPMTLGQIARTDHRRFFGLVKNNQEAKGWVGRDGKQRPPTDADYSFVAACRAALLHMEQAKEQGGLDNEIDQPF